MAFFGEKANFFFNVWPQFKEVEDAASTARLISRKKRLVRVSDVWSEIENPRRGHVRHALQNIFK